MNWSVTGGVVLQIWCVFCVVYAILFGWNGKSDTSSIDHLVIREFVSGWPRYHFDIKGLHEQFVVLEQSSGP